jgi:hypothetical protein
LDGQVLNKQINTANATERAASRGIHVTDTTAQPVTIGGGRELLDDGQSHAVILDPFAAIKAVVNGVETSKPSCPLGGLALGYFFTVRRICPKPSEAPPWPSRRRTGDPLEAVPQRVPQSHRLRHAGPLRSTPSQQEP